MRALGTCSDGEGTWGLQRRLARAVAASASSRRRRRRVVVVASSSRRGWQHLAGNIWCGSVATIGWQQLRHLVRLGGNSCVATFSAARWRQFGGINWVATIAWQHLARLGGNFVLARFGAARWQHLGGNVSAVSSSSPRRRRCRVVVALSSGRRRCGCVVASSSSIPLSSPILLGQE